MIYRPPIAQTHINPPIQSNNNIRPYPSQSIPITNQHITRQLVPPQQPYIQSNQSNQTRPIHLPQPELIVTRPQTAHPQPKRRVQYVPYQQRYIDYVQQRVRVPVQKVKTDYYQVQHIVDYVPIAKEQVVYVTQPQQKVDMRVQYVPVEQRIIHMKEEDAKHININNHPPNTYIQNNNHLRNQNQLQHLPVTFYQPGYTQPYQQKPVELQKSKTNYVTSEGYDPNQRIREIDRVLASSAVRQRMDNQYYNQLANRQQQAEQYNKKDEIKQSGINILESIAAGIGNMKKQSKVTNSGISEKNNVNGSKLRNKSKSGEEYSYEGEDIVKSVVGGLSSLIKNENNNNNNNGYNNNGYNNGFNNNNGYNNSSSYNNNNNNNSFYGNNSSYGNNNNSYNNNSYSNNNNNYNNNNNSNDYNGNWFNQYNPNNEQQQYNYSNNHALNSLAGGLSDFIKKANNQPIQQEDYYSQSGQHILGSIAGGLGDMIKGQKMNGGYEQSYN